MATIAAPIESAHARRASPAAFVTLAVVSFALVAVNPYAALLLSPILLGAPHAISDIWFLLVNDSDVSLRVRATIAILSGLILATALLGLAGLPAPPLVEGVLLFALIAVPLSMTSRVLKTWPLWLIVAALGFLLLGTSLPLLAVVSHLHNVIALIFLFCLAYPRWGARGVAVVAAAIVSLLIVGTYVSFLGGSMFLTSMEGSRWLLFKSLLFGARGGAAGALLFSYGLMQLLHFAVWICFIPTLKGGRSFKELLKGFGFGLPLVGALLLAVTVAAAPLAAVHDPVKARQGYLTLVAFHGWMEIAWLLAHSARLLEAKQFTFRRAFLFDAIQQLP